MIFPPNTIDVDLELKFLAYLAFDDASNLFDMKETDFHHTINRKIFSEITKGTIFTTKKLQEAGLSDLYIDFMLENQIITSDEMERTAMQLRSLAHVRKRSLDIAREQEQIKKSTVSDFTNLVAKTASLKNFTFTPEKLDSEIDQLKFYPRVVYDPRILSDLTWSFEPGWLCGIGASSGVGKTFTAIQVARSISAYEGSEHAYYSLEMNSRSFLKRCLSIKYFSNPDAHWRGWNTVEESLVESTGVLKSVVDRNEILIAPDFLLTVTDIQQHLKKLKQQRPKLKTVVIDHFYLIQSEQNFKDELQVQNARILALDSLAKQFDLRILIVFQTKKRDKDNAYEEPYDSDLLGSKFILNQLWWLILLWKEKNNDSVLNFKVAKTRETGNLGITGQVLRRGTYLYDDLSHYGNPNF